MINFFSGCQTEEQARSRYRDLAKQHHPDKGGDTSTMQEINRQYKELTPVINKIKRQTIYNDLFIDNDVLEEIYKYFVQFIKSQKR